MSLLSLPPEVLTPIVSYIYPGTLVAFACTCRYALACAQERLIQHRALMKRFRLLHDRNPETLLNTLKLFLRDRDAAWYVRDMEFWSHRREYSSWSGGFRYWGLPMGFSDSAAYLDWPDRQVDCRHFGNDGGVNTYSAQELMDMTIILSKTLMLPDEEVAFWMERVAEGSDEVIKMIILALCPEVTCVKFRRGSTSSTSRKGYPLRLLDASIRHIYNSGQQWPCFRSLRTVLVGSSFGDERFRDHWNPYLSDLASLYLLPGVETLGITLGVQSHDFRDPYSFEWSSGVSSCSQLIIRDHFTKRDTVLEFIDGCKQLKELHLVNCTKKFEVEMFQLLQKRSSHTLESLRFRWSDAESVRRSWALQRALCTGEGFPNLVSLDLEISDFIDWENTDPDVFLKRDIEYTPENGAVGHVAWLSIPSMLGPNLRTIQNFSINRNFVYGLIEREAEGFINVLLEFLDAEPQNLVVLCMVGHMVVYFKRLNYGDKLRPLHEFCDKLKERCEAIGCYFHTIDSQTQDCPWCAGPGASIDTMAPIAAIPDKDQWGEDLSHLYVCEEESHTSDSDSDSLYF